MIRPPATIALILKEILHRPFQFLCALVGVAAAVALFVGFYTTGEASKRETARLMRDIGFNLRIVPREADMGRYWAQGFSEATMPEDYVNRFASAENISFTHLLATLQRKINWRGREVLLTGLASREVFAPGRDKPAMPSSFQIAPGTLYVGHHVAEALELKKGDTVELLGETMTVAACLAEMGTEDDIRITAGLEDVQRLLDAPGRINEIKALECLCRDPNVDSLDVLRAEIERILPEAKVIQVRLIAQAREKQRLMAEDFMAFLLPVLAVGCAAWIGVLAMLNVRERREEIGILRALGYGSCKIASLFLGRSVILGLAGAVAGYFAGTGLALWFGPDIFEVTARAIRPMPQLLGWSLVAAPLFSALAGLVPAASALAQDPAETLRSE